MDSDFTPLDEDLCTQWLLHVVQTFDRKIAELSYIFCSDEYLLSINQQYLKHDYYTDVISFPYHDPDEPVQGEIYISVHRVRENATMNDSTTSAELKRVMVHGLLHFLGLEDSTPEQKLTMRTAEDQALSLYPQSI